MRKALEILGHLTDADVEWFMQQGRHRYVPKGSTLIDAGKKLDSVYILLDGQMQVLNGPKRIVVATLLSGEILGEISLVDPRPPQVAVSALTAAHVLDVPRTALQARIASDEGFAARFYFALASYMAGRLRATTSRLGYGSSVIDDVDQDVMEESELDGVTRAASHFNGMLQRLMAEVHTSPAA